MMERPKLRPVEASQVPGEGEEPMFTLRDPLRYSESSITISLPLFSVLQMMDGVNTRLQIQTTFATQFGGLLTNEGLDQIIGQIDEVYLLDSERFEERKKAVECEFADAPVRQSVCAGGAYPGDPEQLREYLGKIFAEDGGPVMPEGVNGEADLVGLISPHIDTDRGKRGYAAAYRELAGNCDAETFVLFGTTHQPATGDYIATNKGFVTPLGLCETDTELLKAVETKLGRSLTDGQYAHKNEHSLEFQVLFLQYVLAGKPFKILPILCNSPLLVAGMDKTPGQVDQVLDFARAMKEATEESGRKTVFVAGADLAHIGPQFGDEFKVEEEVLKDCEEKDRQLLQYATQMDPDGFYTHIISEHDQRRICGLGPIDAMLRCMGAGSSRLLHYGQWVDKDKEGSVSFASVGYYRSKEEGR